jgi:hypothetical protein
MRKLPLAFAILAGCAPEAGPSPDVTLEPRWTDSAVPLVDPGDPVGVTASGVIVARIGGPDSSYRLLDSTANVVGTSAVSAIGIWIAGEDDRLYTLAPGATGIVSIHANGSAGPSYPLSHPGILRGVWRDSVDLVRLAVTGFTVGRVALADGGERVIVADGDSAVTELLDISPVGRGAQSQLASITTTRGRVVVANGLKYRWLIYSADGKLLGDGGRSLDTTQRLTQRQVEAELRQIEASGQSLTAKYLESVRRQLERQRLPFFSPVQGLRHDGAGRLWVVGYQADSAFADLFGERGFVRRLPLGCPGFDGQWDLTGSWLVLACGHRDPAVPGGELQLYRIIEERP